MGSEPPRFRLRGLNPRSDLFAKRLTDITDKAIAESIREIADEVERRFGGAEEPLDWWKPDPEDPYWMLEVRQGFDNAGSWLKNEHTFLTTREPIKALRYPSRFHAECALRRLPLSENHRFEPTDHQWIVPASPTQQGEREP